MTWVKAYSVSEGKLVDVEEKQGRTVRLKDLHRDLSGPPEETPLQMSLRILERAEKLGHEGCDFFCLKCAYEGLAKKLRVLHELRVG